MALNSQSPVLAQVPQRIVSLVPSQTELLFDLGLDEQIVGVTKFCVYPAEKVKLKTKIGGTKNFDLTAIAALKPDLVIGNKEENYQAGIEALRARYRVWLTDIVTLEDALQMIEEVGALVGFAASAQLLSAHIQNAFAQLIPAPTPLPRVAYFIWRKPYMVAASGTFIDQMLQIAGFQNVFSALNRYPAISVQQLQAVSPDLIFLSSEPYPFRQKHFAELQAICPNARVQLIDGELFSWYGSRLQYSAAYFRALRQQF